MPLDDPIVGASLELAEFLSPVESKLFPAHHRQGTQWKVLKVASLGLDKIGSFAKSVGQLATQPFKGQSKEICMPPPL